VTPPARSVADAIAVLADARATLDGASEDLVVPMSAGVHPFASVEGELNGGGRYDRIAASYGLLARRQLVSALQVHVAVGGAEPEDWHDRSRRSQATFSGAPARFRSSTRDGPRTF
jgi:carboxylate-amine ligase